MGNVGGPALALSERVRPCVPPQPRAATATPRPSRGFQPFLEFRHQAGIQAQADDATYASSVLFAQLPLVAVDATRVRCSRPLLLASHLPTSLATRDQPCPHPPPSVMRAPEGSFKDPATGQTSGK